MKFFVKPVICRGGKSPFVMYVISLLSIVSLSHCIDQSYRSMFTVLSRRPVVTKSCHLLLLMFQMLVQSSPHLSRRRK